MSPQQFFSLSLGQQSAFLESVQHATERFEPGFMIMLFEVDGWLLEAYYHRRAGFLQFEELTPDLAAQRFAKTPEPSRLPLAVQERLAAYPKIGLLRKMHNRWQQLLNLTFVPGTSQSLIRSKAS